MHQSDFGHNVPAAAGPAWVPSDGALERRRRLRSGGRAGVAGPPPQSSGNDRRGSVEGASRVPEMERWGGDGGTGERRAVADGVAGGYCGGGVQMEAHPPRRETRRDLREEGRCGAHRTAHPRTSSLCHARCVASGRSRRHRKRSERSKQRAANKKVTLQAAVHGEGTRVDASIVKSSGWPRRRRKNASHWSCMSVQQRTRPLRLWPSQTPRDTLPPLP